MVKIRYHLMGRSGQRIFWIVVIDSRRKRNSKKFLERLGFYDPYTKQAQLRKERIEYWLDKGAQPTKSLRELLQKRL